MDLQINPNVVDRIRWLHAGSDIGTIIVSISLETTDVRRLFGRTDLQVLTKYTNYNAFSSDLSF